ncbi:1,4-alpha-glucan branching protein GlgB [Marinivivus vitaminiproducens]|uniref:1,4-alpha-glucan branching protein GlgB n=1 Tax=Marinivivus vitaminiproducens TaxID=3035935 RepID=UPI00279A0B2E|nr:1,4-alpha-glucan branching protein GlgB [Geminicoccaceae bacterium SCSIO 64248]
MTDSIARIALAPRAAVDALARGANTDPFGLLGPHKSDEGWIVRVFHAEAQAVTLVDASGAVLAEAEKVHPDGLFAALLPKGEYPPTYRVRVKAFWGEATNDDPYRFSPLLGEIDSHLIAEGKHERLWEVLGARPRTVEGVEGVAFAVWAPNARRVSVVGPFNNWDGRMHPMRKRVECGVFELFVPGLRAGELYKYEVAGPDGSLVPLKADPMGYRGELRPRTASVVQSEGGHDWGDASWMTSRAVRQDRHAPISVYEVHLGSWMRIPEDGDRFMTYREMADKLVPYVKGMGFTHIELLPVSEHPFDGSWGYQPTGLFAPTARFGTPDDFAAFVDACHQADLGVILDWVPAHFPLDAHSLYLFDGTHLYEHADPRQGYHLDWNTAIYNMGRNEVANFLRASGLFWMERYHVDALRVDAVASMLYLDYSRPADAWVPNKFGGRENIEAVDFLRDFNTKVFGTYDGATTIAEESTAWPGVSRPTYTGGLGFGFKWNMGWMHDTLSYIGRDPVHRKYHHHELTFGLLYAFSENFILPISHDEVVHGKGSLLARMPGDRWQKFGNLRAYLGFMWGHPGKKLLFMGCEFGQEREWNFEQSLDWHLLDDPSHRGIQRLVRDLNHVYREVPALHRLDADHAGFEWIEANDSEQSVLAFLRKADDGSPPVVVVCNFTPSPRHGYRVGVPGPGYWRERVNTDAETYGGSGMGNGGGCDADEVAWQNQRYSLDLTLPPLATLVLEGPAS